MKGGGEYLNLKDMIDGGGAGASGSTFKGGLLSGLLNDLGVRPRGYEDRMEAMRRVRPPQGRPPQSSPSVTAPAVEATPLTGLRGGRGDYGMPQMTPSPQIYNQMLAEMPFDFRQRFEMMPKDQKMAVYQSYAMRWK